MMARLRRLAAVLLMSWLCAASVALSAPWRPGERNDPNRPACKALWKAIGLPTYTRRLPGRIVVCRDRYVLSYNTAARTPDWVLERMRGADLTNEFGREGSFSRDEYLPQEHQPSSADYQRMPHNFEIGHMAPSEDFNNSREATRDSFQYSNAVPQVGNRFNASIWRRLETEVRGAAVERGEIYVITGPVRAPGASRTVKVKASANKCGIENTVDGPAETHVCAEGNASDPRRGCSSGTVVPVGLFKIIHDPGQARTYAYLMANRDHDRNLGDQTHAYLDRFRVDVGAVQKLTGVKFFGGLPAAKRTKARSQCEREPFWPRQLNPERLENPIGM